MDSPFSFNEHVHRRRNALTGDWVLVSPHRARRPWQGKLEAPPVLDLPRYDPGCYLCPGNRRALGSQNPEYTDTFVFDNDFAALKRHRPGSVIEAPVSLDPAGAGSAPIASSRGAFDTDSLFSAHPETGICRVLCFSPRHDLTLAGMDAGAIRKVVDVWTHEYESLGSLEGINYVQIFENKGAVMGCSNPHPHGQIWAQHTIPGEPARESVQFMTYWNRHGRTLLTDYLDAELDIGARIVCANDHLVALVPFWAVWPFEVLVVARAPRPSLLEFSEDERHALADILARVTRRYDHVFDTSFPYSAGLHQAPTDGQPHPEWHFHMHFYPPLLRSATIKKFMVGYEMLAEPQRDLSAEQSAERLRELPETPLQPPVNNNKPS